MRTHGVGYLLEAAIPTFEWLNTVEMYHVLSEHFNVGWAGGGVTLLHIFRDPDFCHL